MMKSSNVCELLQILTRVPDHWSSGRGMRRDFHTSWLRRCDILAMHSYSVASESVFTVSGNLVDAERTRLSDESTTACMCVRA